MFDRVTLRQLRIFASAGRHLHFGRAAAEMHLTQPAVSIQLSQLETAIGMPLFEQIGRRMHLTEAGDELLRHAVAILARVREADEAFQFIKGTAGGTLSIAATTTAEYFAPRLLAEFRKLHPAVELKLAIDNREAVVRELADNKVDLVLMGRAPKGLDAVATPFAKHPLAVIAAPDHRLAKSKRLELRQLQDEIFLVRERGSGTRSAMERAFSAQGFQPRDTAEIGSNETIKQAVMAGMGLSFLSLHTIGLELTMQRLVVLRVKGTPVIREWYVVHRRKKRLSANASAFKDYLISDGAKLIDLAIS